jgi:mannose-1-phosphate guanylyltransferase/phosphomannomutase
MLRRAATVGLNAAGVDVVDLEVATVPVTCFEVRAGGCDGGLTVRLTPEDPQSVVLRFFDRSGVDLPAATRKRVERIVARQDVRRSLAGEIGDSAVLGRAAEGYTAALTDPTGGIVDVAAVRAARPKVVLDYSYGTASFVMPNVLSKLGAEVLSVNPYASTRQALAFDRDHHAAEVARLVLASGAALGAVIDSDGEQLTLVDDTGHVLSDAEALTVLADLVAAAAGPGAAVVLPVSAVRAAEEAVEGHRARAVLSGLGAAEVLEAALRTDAVLAADPQGGFAFPRFLPAFDAVAALVALLGLLCEGDRSLSARRRRLPVGCVAHRAVATPWARTGAVMRSLLESCHDRELVLVDGIKVLYPDGWALVAPDADAPVTHVWAEAPDASAVSARAAEWAARVEAAGAAPAPAAADSSMFGA